MNNNGKTSIIVPARNEEANIADVLRELRRIGYDDILVIDGNSKDGTAEIAKKYGARVIRQNGVGKGAAIRQVLGQVNGADIVVLMDADGSMRPREIPFFAETLDSDADVVKGSRFLPGGYSEDMNLLRKIGNHFLMSLVNLFWSANYTDLCYGFVAFRKDALEKIAPLLASENFEIEAEIFIKAKKLELEVREIPSIELRRKYGKSNLKIFLDGFRILREIISEFIFFK